MYNIDDIRDKNNNNHRKLSQQQAIQIRGHYLDETPGGKFINVNFVRYSIKSMDDAPLNDILEWLNYEEIYITNFGALIQAIEEANKLKEEYNKKKKERELERSIRQKETNAKREFMRAVDASKIYNKTKDSIKTYDEFIAERQAQAKQKEIDERTKQEVQRQLDAKLIAQGPKGLEKLLEKNHANEIKNDNTGAIQRVFKNSFEHILNITIYYTYVDHPINKKIQTLIDDILNGKTYISNIECLIDYEDLVSDKTREEYKAELESILAQL